MVWLSAPLSYSYAVVGLLLLSLQCVDAFSVGTGRSASRSSTLFATTTNDDGASSQRRQFVVQSIAAGIVASPIASFVQPALSDEDPIDPATDLPKITQKVYKCCLSICASHCHDLIRGSEH